MVVQEKMKRINEMEFSEYNVLKEILSKSGEFEFTDSLRVSEQPKKLLGGNTALYDKCLIDRESSTTSHQ